jgi:hypothetical protein
LRRDGMSEKVVRDGTVSVREGNGANVWMRTELDMMESTQVTNVTSSYM